MENNRGSWGSTFGFIMAAVGSAVGLGNIWGFPYKMGKCGGFSFLLIYLLLAVFVGIYADRPLSCSSWISSFERLLKELSEASFRMYLSVT